MRRSLFVLAVALIALSGFAVATLPADAVAADSLQFQQVNMTIACLDGAFVEATIEPLNIRLSRRDSHQVRWRLLPASDVGTATIRPTSDSSWPFASTPPLTVTSADSTPVNSGAISAENGKYFYDIVVDCGDGEQVLEPRIDIER